MKTLALSTLLTVSACLFAAVSAGAQQPPPPASQQDDRAVSPSLQAHEKEARVADEKEDAEKDDPRARLEAQRGERGRLTTEFKQHLLRQRQQQIANRRLPEPNIVATSGPRWVPIGPTDTDYEQNGSFTGFVIDSGRARAILPDPVDANTVYFLTSGGGLWKTTNFLSNPPTWIPLTDNLVSTSGGSVAFGRTSSVLYLGLGDPFDVINVAGVMVKSIDGGATWTATTPVDLGTPFSVRDIKVDFSAGTTTATDIILVATDAGLFRSTDGGTSFHQVALGGAMGLSVWSIVNTSAGWLASAQPCSFQPATECGTTSTMYVSADHGATWAAITNTGNGFNTAGRTTLAVGSTGAAIVYAFSENLLTSSATNDQRGLFRSTDGGQTWTDLGLNSEIPTNPNTDNPNMDLMHNQAFYNQMMLVDPSDATGNTLYLGGNLSSAKSTDGGNTWTLLTNWLYGRFGLPYVHADMHAAAFSNIAGNKTLFFGSDGGIFVSSDSGATWSSSKNQGLQTFLVYSITSTSSFPSEVMIGTQDNGTRVRKGATTTYNQSRGGDGVGTASSQANSNTWMTSVPGNSYAVNLTNQAPDTLEGFLFSTPPLVSDSVFAVPIATPTAALDPAGKTFFSYSGQQVYKTIDGGLTWTIIGKIGGATNTITLPTSTVLRATVHGIGVSPVDLLHIGVDGGAGNIAFTTDGGTTWTGVDLNSALVGFASFTSSFTWADNSTMYVTSVAPQAGVVRIAKSVNGGASWARADGALPDVPVNRLIVDPRDVTKQTLYAASLQGIFRSTDGGASWAPFGTGLSNAYVSDLYMPPDGSFLRMASYGRGVWELPFLTFSGATITDDVASCDHDGVLDNGETGHLTVTLHNDGGSTLSSITGTVNSSNSAVSFPSGTTIVFPPVAAGASTSGSVQVALNGATGIQQMDFTISYNDPALSLPGPVTALASFRGNDDEKPAASVNDNIEAQTSAWTVTGTAPSLPDTATWQRRTISQVEHRWATYDSNVTTDVQLVSPTLQVGGGSFSVSWEQRYSFEFNGANFFDGMVLEISQDGGTTWADVGGANLTPTYDHTLVSSALSGRPAYSGLSTGYPNFVPVTLSLGTTFAGKSVKLRFREATDNGGGGPGVEIRNITTTGLTNTPFSAVTAQTPCGTTTALISSLNPSSFGNNVTFTATVTGGTGIATGNVTFADGATTLGTNALDGTGKATVATAALTVGTHPITASYAGDSAHAASVSPIVQQVVNAAALNPSTTALASSLNPSVSGQSVTFTATVTSTSAGTPTGNVTFKDGATVLGTTALNASAVATFATSALTAGSHSITATYSGDATFAASSSTALTQGVKGTTATAVTSSLNPSTTGQLVTFTATVTSTAAGTPTGNVTFKDGATTLGTGVLNASGIATFATSALAVGSHSITATYAGDASFASSTSSALSQTVNLSPTSTAVTSSLNPSTAGQSVTFTATVTSTAAGTPTGNVTFKDGAATLGTGALNASGIATFATSALTAGSHSITAQYAGDANFAGSTSSVLTQTVKGTTNTALGSSANPSANGQSVTFTATVTSTAAGTPTGNVTFKDGATTLGTTALNASGVATFATAALAPGAHSITAAYAGDANFAASTSTVLTQTVNLSPSSTAVTSSLNPSTAGQSVTFTATVTSTAAGTPTGTVTFKDGAATLGAGALNASGVAAFATSTLTAGSHSITAVYAGDANFVGSTSAALMQTVKATTNAALTSSVNPSAAGQSVTFTTMISSTAPGTPTGIVTFKDGANTLGTGALNASGVATFTTSTLATGSHSITAVYAGDANFIGSTSNTVTQAVNVPATVNTVASSINPSTFGQSVTFTATVTSAAAGTPTGTVTFKDGANTLGISALNASAAAAFTTSALATGSHSITAVYAGDANFAGSTSNTLTQTVNQAASATVVTSSLNPSTTGQSVAFTATVTSTAGTPTGIVTFKDGAATLGTGALNASGVAIFTTSTLTAGSHQITAAYGGDTNFAGSTSPVFTQSVKGTTNTALASSVNPSASGQSVTFTATVTSAAAGTPTGNVTFKDGANTLSTGALNASGVATFTTSTLANGSHSITAVYAGDANFGGSTSNTVTQAVNLAATVSAVVPSVNPSTFGQSVTFTATITSTAAGTPTGTVTFKDGANTLGTGTLNASAVATFTASALTGGSHSIMAVYGGDATFAGSTSAALTQTVNVAVTSTAVTSSLNPAAAGQSVTFTATVASTASTPTGTATFKDRAVTLGTGALNASGVATFATNALAAGSHTITAVYGGDANFAASTSTALTQTVKGATSTAVTSSLNPSTIGQSVTLTATVTFTGAGAPTGAVTFKDGTNTLGTGALNASGVATFATTVLAAGNHSVTAVYAGDANFAGSTSNPLTQTVNLPVTATAVTSTANPSNVGQSVTFTATVTSPAAGTPTGSVTFKDGATTIGTGALNASAIATFATTALTAGSHAITAVYAGDANFATSTSLALTQTVNAPDFSVSATPQTQNITAGQSGMVMFTVTPLNGSVQTVTFSCSGLPAHTACTFVPPSVTLDGTHNGTSTGTIQTTVNAGLPFAPKPQRPQPRVPYVPLTLFALTSLAAFLSASLSPRRSLRRFASFAALLMGITLGLAACSGQKMATGTPTGSYSIMITGTASGGATHSAAVAIVVK